MAENKKSFLLYCDLIHTVSKMPKEKAGELFLHILQYVNDENPETDDLIIQLSFEPIKQSLKRDLVKWEQTILGRSKAGKASAEARKKQKEQETTNLTNVDFVEQTSTNPTVNVIDSVNVNDIYYKELLISESWIEINAKNNRSTPEKVKQYLKRFNNNLIAQGDKKNNKREYQSHFARWLPLEIEKDNKEKPKSPPLL